MEKNTIPLHKLVIIISIITSVLIATPTIAFAKSSDKKSETKTVSKASLLAHCIDTVDDFIDTMTTDLNEQKKEQDEQKQEKTAKEETSILIAEPAEWDGPVLTPSKGVNQGPQGKETYYNLPMDGVVSIMRNAGFSEDKYPYWEREDGCKMLGPYIMVAANLNTFPRGSVIDCSLGKALVCDTGGFAKSNPTQLDIATNW